jgi:putative RNA 2'-phosphotransferase
MSRDSKLLSRILRHTPHEIGLTLDAQGWVLVDDLLKALRRAGRPMTRAELIAVIALDDKQRFTLSADGRRLRAAQGHSILVDLQLAPAVPPEVLYHGTSRRSLDAIFAMGLRPGRRRQVHLSPERETAQQVGQRHGKPVVLRVAAAHMHREGHTFQRSENGVWLTDQVPAVYLSFDGTGA